VYSLTIYNLPYTTTGFQCGVDACTVLQRLRILSTFYPEVLQSVVAQDQISTEVRSTVDRE